MTATQQGDASENRTVGLVFGGRSAEHKVSVVSARTVARALADAGHRVVPIAIAQDGGWVDAEVGRKALDGALDAIEPFLESLGTTVAATVAANLARLSAPGSQGSRVDVIFPIVHGTWGEDGTLQGFCEMLDLPYAGPGVTASAVCMDKVLCKEILRGAGIPVVPWETATRAGFRGEAADALLARCRERFTAPVFVKPSVGGSSVGVRKVGTLAPDPETDPLRDAIEHALRFDERVLIEQGVTGRELECSVLGGADLAASGIGEIVPGKDFYDYADKYVDDGAELIHDADLPPATRAHLRDLAVRAFAAVGGWGMARVDFLLDDDGPKVNEINTLPGFTSISMYPKLWNLAGLDTPSLVDRLVQIAVERHAERRRLDDGIKSWIASLG